MSKKKLYMVVDTETATLPFVNEMGLTAEQKKKIAIAKPLVYDIGWTIVTKRNEVVESRQFLVAETFSIPSIFNTAYYKEKRPIYLEKLSNGETSVKPWNDIMEIFISDLEMVDCVGAFNAMFDFKKAIPFTELYISKLYSPYYFIWEKDQHKFCDNLLKGNKPSKNPNFDSNNFILRGKNYPMFDIWGEACSTLINKPTYKKMCLEYGMVTESGDYFKTSAESTYRYLMNRYDFDEAHTALEDARIEAYILSKILHDKGIKIGIDYFPFQRLGNTTMFLVNSKNAKEKHFKVVIDQMEKKLDCYDEQMNDANTYAKALEKKRDRLVALYRERFM